MTEKRWFLALYERPERRTISFKIVPGTKEEQETMFKLLAEGGAGFIYVFTREITAEEILPLIPTDTNEGGSIVQTFRKDIELLARVQP